MDPIHVIDYEPLQHNKDLSHEKKKKKKKPIRILTREVKALRNRNIALRCCGRNHHTKETTWESEVEISEKLSELVQELETFEDESSF